ncbi:MAG: hypothetical protein N2515_01180 [Deltaproteobacteria bacterium]|nr:hypothetical protein [Deltaproteobacteria bacterium]
MKSGSKGFSIEAARLFPLQEGSSWTYESDPGDGSGLQTLVLRVRRSDGPRFVVESLSSGRARTYELREDGIFWVEEGAYLLKHPVTVGSHWQAAQGRTAEILSTAVEVEAPAGRWGDCVDVKESNADSTLVIHTIYCPHVGPVVVEVRQVLSISGKTIVSRARLRAFALGHEEVSEL